MGCLAKQNKLGISNEVEQWLVIVIGAVQRMQVRTQIECLHVRSTRND